MLRTTGASVRADRTAASAAAIAEAVAAADERDWIGCGDLIDSRLRMSNPFKWLPDTQRFALSYVIDPRSGCWPWVGSRKAASGYGQIRYDGRNCNAHRVSYEFFVGPVPDGLTLDHTCRTKYCVNPDHLEPVTQAENTKRWASSLATCAQGHERSPENTIWKTVSGRRKRDCRVCHNERCRQRSAAAIVRRIALERTTNCVLTDDDLARMRELRAAGARVKDIAEQYGITPKYASAVITGSRSRRRTHTGPTTSALRLLRARSGGMCEYVDCRAAAEHSHHRRPRKLGGSRDPLVNLPSNLLRLCAGHHEWVESHRAAAYARGLLLHSGEVPSATSVDLVYGLVFLDDVGGWELAPGADGTYVEAS